MSIRIKRALCVALWLAALIACLLLADRAFRRDDGERKYGLFFSETQGFDVQFYGTSRVLDGVQPMQLWRDYGVTSYNMGNNSECLEMTEWVMKLAFEYQKPKVAVIDVYYVDRNIDDEWAYAYRHLFLDEIPFGPAKFEAVRATLPQSYWTEYLMPLSLYHGRWEEILSGKTERLVDCETYMMGAELRVGRESPAEPYVRTKEMNTEPMAGKDALRRIAALCRENGVEPVFMAIPGPVSAQEQMNMNGVQLVADELGVPFLNLFDVEGLIDFDSDCYDYLGHFNPDGAAKLTKYLGDWLTENYDLADRRGDKALAHWDENLALYEAQRETVWSEWTRLD